MQAYNVILLYDKNAEHILLCKRRKNPYLGMYNLVGGKIEPGEDGLDAAYRELLEETGVGRDAVALIHLMDFTYFLSECRLEVYAGKLRCDLQVAGEENELFWSELNRDFFDTRQFAGEGNIGHMIEQVKLRADRIFVQQE